ncbi:GNAT family N-acetyltransferase [Amycolatopsis sp. 195334CR]|uniref:GNAT family N-acetyltransferase n=1 Tax=Amycolatopsis sp. 195334CR TaxID=2814588 RepID=UPI001A8ED3EF|nr:GNAT family N-acetyltransferase [Amycolatopsis sp. 195334CR]MBN6038602.1 GNAT family N-acetyltransferase [Amycolatopsis sp. 195334CR]
MIRRAGAADAPAAAEVWLRSFATLGVRQAHPADEVRAWFAGFVVPRLETWVSVDDGSVTGLLVLDGPELAQLYLDPDRRGQGLGDRFVALAKRQRPDGLELRTFQVNAPARRFYRRHGFTEVEWTDGSGNEEGEPDVKLVWSP